MSFMAKGIMEMHEYVEPGYGLILFNRQGMIITVIYDDSNLRKKGNYHLIINNSNVKETNSITEYIDTSNITHVFMVNMYD